MVRFLLNPVHAMVAVVVCRSRFWAIVSLAALVGLTAYAVTPIPHISSFEGEVANATIAHDANGSGTAVNSSTFNWNHTVGSGSDRFLVVGLASSVNSASSVTYGGTAMTRIGARDTGTGHIVEMWVLANPASGTNAIVATFIASKDRVGFSTSWENVHPGSAVGSFANNAGTNVGPLTVDVATAEGDMVVDISVANGRPVTVDASQIERGNDISVTVHAGMSSEPASGTSVTMSWTISDSTNWAIAAIPLHVVSYVPAPTAVSSPTSQPPPPADLPATAAGLPSTGGTPSDGGSVSPPWLAAIAGVMALAASGGAWFAYQGRRVH